MGNGYQVEPAALRAHSKQVDQLAGRAGNAAEAGHHLASLDDAYGLLCWQLGLPLMLREPQESAASAIDNLRNLLEATADKLKRSADHYEQVEDAHSQRLVAIGEKLDAANEPPTLGGGQGSGQ